MINDFCQFKVANRDQNCQIEIRTNSSTCTVETTLLTPSSVRLQMRLRKVSYHVHNATLEIL